MISSSTLVCVRLTRGASRVTEQNKRGSKEDGFYDASSGLSEKRGDEIIDGRDLYKSHR